MPTKEEIKQMEKFFKKPFSQIDKIDIPAYIRQREFNEEMNLIDELERAKEDKGRKLRKITGQSRMAPIKMKTGG